MKPDRINSLTGLRAVVMMTVFCSHLWYLAETPFHGVYAWIDNGRLGVNFFLVLSGFVLALGYSKKLNADNIKQDVRFVKNRFSKIYIPYLITTILAIPWYIFIVSLGEGSVNVKLLLIRLVINIGMVQSAVPFEKYSTSINDVSWFISTIFIIYLITPGILRLNNKAAKHYTLPKLLFLILYVLFVYCCCYMIIRWIEYIRYADRGLSIIYRSPLIRVFPFLLGIVTYNIYCIPDKLQIKNGSYIEATGISVFLLWWIFADKSGLPTLINECTDMLVSMLVVLIFAFSRRGIISGFLSNEKMLNWGRISLEFYLIHFLVINYGMIAAKQFGLDMEISAVPLTILFFVLSLGGSWLIHSFTERLLPVLRKGMQ